MVALPDSSRLMTAGGAGGGGPKMMVSDSPGAPARASATRASPPICSWAEASVPEITTISSIAVAQRIVRATPPTAANWNMSGGRRRVSDCHRKRLR
jgi:hypothetical protein